MERSAPRRIEKGAPIVVRLDPRAQRNDGPEEVALVARQPHSLKSVHATDARDELAREANAEDVRRRVLIVDDDLEFLAVAEASLEAHGFDVAHASGGLRGVFLATQDVPDAVLCDLRMPGIDGFVVAEALRADPATRRTAIFACTARRDLEARAMIESSAFDGVVQKPVDWDDCATRLERAITSRNERSAADIEPEE